jgi:replicative DNA helicase
VSAAAENVIGGILLGGKDAYWRVADLLTAEDFPSLTLANIYRVCGDVAKSSAGLDAITVGDEIERLYGRELAGDPVRLASATTSAANVRGYAELVKAAALTRRVQAICLDGSKSGDLATVQASLSALLSSQPAHAVHAREAVKRMWAGVEARYYAGDDLSGLVTGIPLLDEMTGGLQPGRVYGIGARAKMGKSVLAANICADIAAPPFDRDGVPIRAAKHAAIWTLEMSDEELMQRMACARASVPATAVQRPKLLDSVDGGFERLHAATKELMAAPLYISDRLDVSIEQIESQARQMHAAGQLDVLCIDYLGLLKLPKMDRHDLSIAHATRRTKIIAKELRIPVLLVFQLNRGSENGQQVRPPRPSDARDSGAIEQDLDAMLLLHRPSYYDKSAPKGLRLDLALQRNGPTGLIHMHDELHYCRFTGGEHEWTDAQRMGGRDDDL